MAVEAAVSVTDKSAQQLVCTMAAHEEDHQGLVAAVVRVERNTLIRSAATTSGDGLCTGMRLPSLREYSFSTEKSRLSAVPPSASADHRPSAYRAEETL
ncbi:MAG: hypothetical protein WAK69_03385, partial [Rhodoplanes sp.]